LKQSEESFAVGVRFSGFGYFLAERSILFKRIIIFYAAAALWFLTSCQTLPPHLGEDADLSALSRELGQSFADLENYHQLRPPFSGFNEGRNLSLVSKTYFLGGLPFEVVFIFDQAGRQGHLREVEGVCRELPPGQAAKYREQILEALRVRWGEAKVLSGQEWSWEKADFSAVLLAPLPKDENAQATWLLSLEETAPGHALAPDTLLPNLGGWERALFGSTLAELEKLYFLGDLGRSSLNDKPAAMVKDEVIYFGYPFKAAFFFDRFTLQAVLVGVDLYLLEDQEPGQWQQKRDALISALNELYGQSSSSRDGHRFTWVWKDRQGSLTFTDTSRGRRTTWLLSFRPGRGHTPPPPALAAPRTYQDITGWANVRFGMSPAQVELLYTGQTPAFIALAGSGYGFEDTLQFEDLNFKVLFLFDRQAKPARLTQVVLSRQAFTNEEENLQKRAELMNMLTAWYGPSSQNLLKYQGGGKAVWHRQSGSLEFHDMPELKTWVLNYRAVAD
jgi:hypothetical protein